MLTPPKALLLVSLAAVSSLAQTIHGNLFLFVPDLGACGVTNTSEQVVASVPSKVFSSFPGAGANPNKNPICHHSVFIKFGSTNLTVPVVDYYVDKSTTNVGLSRAGFVKFADVNDGIVHNVSWSVV
ncbi:hypothetical protein CPC08DRAFT_707080 [Agrocybe pediades]|nr:hypothetical protein CPC08DRAFT_707080 [Agrocybe pediades]